MGCHVTYILPPFHHLEPITHQHCSLPPINHHQQIRKISPTTLKSNLIFCNATKIPQSASPRGEQSAFKRNPTMFYLHVGIRHNVSLQAFLLTYQAPRETLRTPLPQPRNRLILWLVRSPDTGVIECEIRLPCNSKHTFGSACIATWLEQNNTCPMCRTELFPMSDYDSDDDGPSPLHNDPLAPAPRVRRTRLVDREAAEQHAAARRIETVRLGRAERISILVITHSTTLNFHAAVTRCALTIADQLDRSHSLGDRSDSAMAAAAIYVASYLRRSPIALERICQLTDSTEGTVQAIYRRFYASVYREEPYHWEQIFNTPYGLPAGHPHAPPVSTTSVLLFSAFHSPPFILNSANQVR